MTRTPVSRSKGQKLKGQGRTGPTNADTHRVPSSELHSLRIQTWHTDEGRRPASATGAMTFRVKNGKVARSHDQSEPSWLNAVPVSLEAGGGIPCRPNPAATPLVSTVVFDWKDCYMLLSATC